MTELFERIQQCVDVFAEGSQTKFAKKIGQVQTTFNGYFSETGQRKIRLSLLNDILKEYPQISRDWLYFDEGEMLRDGQPPVTAKAAEAENDALAAAQDKISELEADLREERRLNRQLTARLLLDDTPARTSSNGCTGKTAENGQK